MDAPRTFARIRVQAPPHPRRGRTSRQACSRHWKPDHMRRGRAQNTLQWVSLARVEARWARSQVRHLGRPTRRDPPAQGPCRQPPEEHSRRTPRATTTVLEPSLHPGPWRTLRQWDASASVLHLIGSRATPLAMVLRRWMLSFGGMSLFAGLAHCGGDDSPARPPPSVRPEASVAARLVKLTADESAALFSVSGTSEKNVWAVGADKGKGPLVLHFDGTSWSRVATGHRGDLWWIHTLSLIHISEPTRPY